jgi:tetratricopeptide (TPR) repeat protein
MAEEQAKSVKVFISYARKDERICKELEKRLHDLVRHGLISLWNDSIIQAGYEWKHEIEKHLHSAQIILLLITPDFIASDRCYQNEMVQAMKMHEAGEARVIPIIVRPVLWEDQPFSKLLILPSAKRPLTTWNNMDKAYVEIYQNIKSVVFELLTERYLKEADVFERYNRHEEALALIEEAMFLGLSSARIHWRKGNFLFIRGRFEEALASYDETIRLDPSILNSYFYQCKADVLRNLNRFEDALSTYIEAIRLGEPDPDPILYHYKGLMYEQLARQAYAKAKLVSQVSEL